MAELRAGRDAATAGDLIELRLDGVVDLDVAAALAGRSRPVIVTCRAAWEGGRFDGSEEERCRILEQALAGGAERIDIEFAALAGLYASPRFAALLRTSPDRVVVSTHDFSGVPADLADRAAAMRRTGAGVIKVAVMAARLSDTIPLIDIGREGRAVVIGMGDAGVPSRLLAARFGSPWTYAGNGAAPGQIPARRMIDEFRFRTIGPDTRLFGVVSTNAMHSLSPAMHNAAFAAARLDAVYLPLRAADFDDFLAFAAALGIEGASITIPFKLDALAAAANADTLTRSVGAANTLRRSVDGWDATNTDVAGFLRPLESAYPGSLRGARASILGAGGSARAVAVALASSGARVTMHARRPEQSADAARGLGVDTGAWPPSPGSWDLLVNCTPLGGATMRDESPLPDARLDGVLVYDLTYGAGPSRLLRDAARDGCRTLDGLPMLVAQAERQFAWWTGSEPPTGVMGQAAATALARHAEPVHADAAGAGRGRG